MLNAKQEKFCIEYARNPNAADAYRKAGYTAKNARTASASAARLLANASIKKRLAELREELHKEDIASISEIQAALTKIMRLEQTEETVVVEGCGDGVSQATIIHKKPALKDAIKAGETLAKMQGAFDTSVKVNLVVPVIGGDDSLED